jgi:hypothetical protein
LGSNYRRQEADGIGGVTRERKAERVRRNLEAGSSGVGKELGTGIKEVGAGIRGDGDHYKIEGLGE